MKLTLEKANTLMAKNNGNLDLRDTGITSLPDNLTVGGDLYLRGTGITTLPDNLTVGGGLDLSGTGITDRAEAVRKVRRLKNGDMEPDRYIYVDGILMHLKGSGRKVDGYTVYRGKIPGQYLVTDGAFWAHCRTPREGIADILYKRAADRGAEQYADLDLDEERTVEELKTMYRIITGACRAGTEAFVSGIKDLKERYTVREAIALTRGQYNSEAFERFFGEARA